MLRFLLPYIAHAQIEYDISTPIPSSGDVAFSDINTYVSSIFSFGVYLAFGLALTIIVYGGVRYAASFANEKEISGAKDWIWSAFAGLLVLITATLLLNTINPDILTANPFSGSGGGNSQTNSSASSGTIEIGQFCQRNDQCRTNYCDIFQKTTESSSGKCANAPDTSGEQCRPNSSIATEQCPTGQSCIAEGFGDKYICKKVSLVPQTDPAEIQDCTNIKLKEWCSYPNECRMVGSGIAACISFDGAVEKMEKGPIKISDYLRSLK